MDTGTERHRGIGHVTMEAEINQSLRPRISGKHQKLEEERRDPSLEPPGGAWPCCHRDLTLPGSETVKESMSVALSSLVCGNLFG